VDAVRLAKNESVFRRVNESVVQLAERFFDAAERLDFLCECANVRCTERFSATVGEYEEAHVERDQFIVVPAHFDPALERVVAEHAEYLIVEKLGLAGEVAEDEAG